MKKQLLSNRCKLSLCAVAMAFAALTAHAAADRAAMAYNLQAAEDAENSYTISYNVTSTTATSATLILTDRNDNSVRIPLTSIEQGVNTYTLNLLDIQNLAFGSIKWEVEVNSTVEGTAPQLVYSAPTNFRTAQCKGMVLPLIDPENENFGQFVVVQAKDQGFLLLDQDLNKMGKYHAGCFNNPKGENTAGRADVYGTKVVMSDYSDGNSGFYVWDTATPDVAPYQMFAGERQSGSGQFKYNGVAIGGSQSAVCISKDGRHIYGFDEDANSAKSEYFTKWLIEDDWTIKTAPEYISTKLTPTSSGLFPGHAQCVIIDTEYGKFFSQYRANVDDDYPCVVFWNEENDVITYRSGNKTIVGDTKNRFAQGSGGIALSHDNRYFAFHQVNTKNLRIHPVEFVKNSSNLYAPSFSDPEYTISLPTTSQFTSMNFDYAGNLYVYVHAGTTVNPVLCYAFPGDHTVSTPAPSSQVIKKIDVSAPMLYCATSWEDANWDPANAHRFDLGDDDIYSITLPAGVTEFKISTKLGSWDDFNSQSLCVDNNENVADANLYDCNYNLVNGNANIAMWSGTPLASDEWTIYVDLANKKLWAELPYKIYLRGDMNGWLSDAASLDAASEWTFVKVDDETYTISGVTLEKGQRFRIADRSYVKSNYGSAVLKPGSKCVLTNSSESDDATVIADVANTTLTFNPTTGELHAVDTRDAVRSHYVYGHTWTYEEGKLYLKFKATGEINGAVAKFYKYVEDEPVEAPARHRAAALHSTIDIASITAGENTVEVPDGMLAPGSIYTWEIEVPYEHSSKFERMKYTTIGDKANNRAGIAAINDPNSPLDGHFVVCQDKGNGLYIFDPNLVCVGGPYLNTAGNPFTGGADSPCRVEYSEGTIFISDYSDATSGVWAWDPTNPEKQPKQVFQGEWTEGGIYVKDGVQIGGTTPSVRFTGSGKNRIMWHKDADVTYGKGTSKSIVGQPLNDDNTISEQPVTIIATGAIFRTDNDLWVSEQHNGIWSSQYRGGAGNDSTPMFFYFSFDGTVSLKWGHHSQNPTFSHFSSGAVAVSPDESLLFIPENVGIGVYDITWTGDVPSVEFNQYLKNSSVNSAQYGWGQMAFDKAGNLVAAGNQGKLALYAIPSDPVVTAHPASWNASINVTDEGTPTYVDSIAADEAEAEYFNLNGVRISADNLTPGIYVRRAGTKATKVIIR